MKKILEVLPVSDAEGLRAAQSVRLEVFVQEQGVPAQEEIDAHEASSMHYIAQYNGQVVGAARWRKTPLGCKLERFAVLKAWRGKQVGQALLNVVLADALAQYPGQTIYLHAQQNAVGFYEKSHFKTQGVPFDECDIVHYKMIYSPNQ